MLRYIYLSSLLLFLNTIYCFEYSSDIEPSYRLNKKSKPNTRFSSNKEKNYRKRQDYEMVYDNEPMAQIDVASFIQSPDNSLEDNQPYENENDWKQTDYGGSLIEENEEFANKMSADYRNLDMNNLPEVNIYSKTTHIVPQNIDLNAISVSDHLLNTYKLNGMKDVKDLSFEFGHNTEKKCALKNMKIPFFSRKKDTITTDKEQRKRWLFLFGKSKKQTPSFARSNFNSNDVNKVYTELPHMKNRVKKRSFKKLCPSCQENNMVNKVTNDVKSLTSNDVIHNSRQYYQSKYDKQKSKEMERSSNLKKKNSRRNFALHSVKNRRLRRDIKPSLEEKHRKELEEIATKNAGVNV